MWQKSKPLPRELGDSLLGQPITDPLERLGIGTRKETVVQRLVRNASAVELALGVLVTVDADLAVVREVRAQLDEEGAEVPVHAVEVVVGRRCGDSGSEACHPAEESELENPDHGPLR